MTTPITAKPWQPEKAWLSSGPFDTLFIFGVLLLALFSGLVVWNEPDLLGLVFFIDAWFLGYHHVIATFTKLSGTADDRRENHFLIYYLPFIVIAAVAALYFTVGIWIIITIYFFWQWYHYTRQSYGISSFYHRKATNPSTDNPLLTQATLWSVPIWGILYRSHQGWDTFLFQPFWTPPVSSTVVTIAAIISISLVTYWLITRLIALRNGTLPLGQTLFMLSHFIIFYVAYILIANINIGWLVANIWHNAQYILFVWLYNTRRFEADRANDSWLSWASQNTPVRTLSYFIGCIVLASIVYGTLTNGFKLFIGDNKAMLMTFYVVTFQTINFHHYIVDALIWKARKKQHQAVMKLNQN